MYEKVTSEKYIKKAPDWRLVKLSSLVAQKRKHTDIVSIVVTHNRKALLLKCIDLILRQTFPCDLLIVDNASSDGTRQELLQTGLLDDKRVHFIQLNKNTGGAGGFYYGLKYAFDKGWSWFWLMDDDAEPHRNALERVVYHAKDKNAIYGSAAISDLNGVMKLCFPAKKLFDSKTEIIEDYNLLAVNERVAWLPFLGFFIHRDIVAKVGLPNRNLFIRNDDIEYAERAKLYSIKIYMIKESIIIHPFQPIKRFILAGQPIYHRSMPSWKMYYEVRNKIILCRKYYSFSVWLRVMSGVSLQVMLSIITEKGKMEFVKSYFRGLIDGVFKT